MTVWSLWLSHVNPSPLQPACRCLCGLLVLGLLYDVARLMSTSIGSSCDRYGLFNMFETRRRGVILVC